MDAGCGMWSVRRVLDVAKCRPRWIWIEGRTRKRAGVAPA